jgi:hypothetical protein
VTLPKDALFRRSFRVTIADKQFGSEDGIRPLTFSFSVQRDKTITPNNATLLLTNLSQDTRDHLEELSGGTGQGLVARNSKLSARDRTSKKAKPGVAVAVQGQGVAVRIEAGYGENMGQIFFGVLRRVSSWKSGSEWLTEISGGDGEGTLATAKISKTFVKGTPITSVVRACVGALGVGPGGLNNTLSALETSGLLTGGRVLERALTLHGDAATELDQVLRSCGFEWSIQDGNFYAGPAGTPTFPGQGPLLTPQTGLLDTPRIEKNGKVVGTALLNPDLLPGRVFRIQSSRVTGNFVCSKTQHRGESTADPWEVQFVGDPPAPGSKAAILAKALGDTGF